MQRVSVAELKARLSEYLGVVKSGEEVVVTDRGKPVARLTGLSAPDAKDARTAELIRAGLMRPPRGHLSLDAIKSMAVPLKKGANPNAAVDAIIEERRSGL